MAEIHGCGGFVLNYVLGCGGCGGGCWLFAVAVDCLGRDGAVAAWGRGCGWVLINQRSFSDSKPK